MEGKTQFSKAQVVAMVTSFLIGTSLLIPPGQQLGNHAWISTLLSYGIFLLVLPLYHLLANLEPKKSLFALTEMAFGKILGAIVNLFYLLYFFILLVLIFANFINFINSTILINTPDLLISILLVVITAYGVKAGLKPIAKLSELMIIYVLFNVVITTLMLLGKLDLSNFLPLLPNNWSPVLSETFSILSFPFLESVVFLGFLCVLGKPEQIFPGFFKGSLIALLTILLAGARNVAVLGAFTFQSSYPSFEAARLISIGQVLTRVEVLIAINFIFAGYLKASITYYSLCRGFKETFHLKTYKQLVLPIGALTVLNAHLSFPTIIQNFYFNAEIYRYYAIVPQVLLVLLTYLVLLFKRRRTAK